MSNETRWRRIVAEGAVIVVSILLAFGIQAWWDTRQERLEERRLLEALYQDFTETQNELEFAIARHRDWGSAAATLAEFGLSDGAVALPDVGTGIVSVLVGVITTHPKTDALDGALSSGKLDLISDPEIRSLLAGWPRAEMEFTEKQDYLWDLAAEIRPLLFAAVPVAAQVLAGSGLADAGVVGELGVTRPDPPSLSRTPEFVAFLRSEAGQAYAAYRAAWEGFAVRDGQELLLLLNEILERLTVELE